MIEIITGSYGSEIVFITNEDGSTVSMPKSVYDEQQAATEKPATSWTEPVLTK